MSVTSGSDTGGDDRRWKADTRRCANVLKLDVAACEEIILLENLRSDLTCADVQPTLAKVSVNSVSLMVGRVYQSR